MTVQWNPLPQQYHNGRLLGYRVFFRKTANSPFPVDVSSVAVYNTSWVTLNNLEPGQPYEVNVSAFTSKGDGPRSTHYIVTTGKSDTSMQSFFSHEVFLCAFVLIFLHKMAFSFAPVLTEITSQSH